MWKGMNCPGDSRGSKREAEGRGRAEDPAGAHVLWEHLRRHSFTRVVGTAPVRGTPDH